MSNVTWIKNDVMKVDQGTGPKAMEQKQIFIRILRERPYVRARIIF